MTNFNLSALAVRERAVTLFLIIAITLAGAYAFAKLGPGVVEVPTAVSKPTHVACCQWSQDVEPNPDRSPRFTWN